MPNTIAYTWSQTPTQLALRLRIPSLKADLLQLQRNTQLSVVVSICYVRVCWHPWILELDLWDDVVFQSAKVIPGAECLTIIVPKAQKGLWGSVCATSNPRLRQNGIRQRRERAIADYTQWQEQLNRGRVGARDALKEAQQKRLWKQQKEQREWQQRQKSLQVEQVLQQIDDDERTTPEQEKAKVANSHKRVDYQVTDIGIHGIHQPQGMQTAHSAQGQSQQSHNGVDPCLRASWCEDEDKDCGSESKLGADVTFDSSFSSTNSNEALQADPKAAADSAMTYGINGKNRNAPVDLSAGQVVCSAVLSESVRGSASLAATKAHTTQPESCTKVRVSFGPRRPNRVPARGPRAPPLPHTGPDLRCSGTHRATPNDLSRVLQTSPQWLQSKAARLLMGGDVAAAAEAYATILELAQQHSQHRFVIVKALCGRSLARLALGENKGAISDCKEGMAILQEHMQQEETAAAVAGQPLVKSLEHNECMHLQRIILARQAAAFLRLDSLEDAAKSLEELLQLYTTVDGEFGGSDRSDQERIAVAADLMHVKWLQEIGKAKAEADTALRLALAARHKLATLEAPSANSTAADHQPDEIGLARGSVTMEQTATSQRALLLRCIGIYTHSLENLLAQVLSESDQPGRIVTVDDGNCPCAVYSMKTGLLGEQDPASSTSTNEKITFTETETHACERAKNTKSNAREADQCATIIRLSRQVEKSVKASEEDGNNFPCAAAAATVIANMTLALMLLQQRSERTAAESALTAADALIWHVEEQLRLQHVLIQPKFSWTEEHGEDIKKCEPSTEETMHKGIMDEVCHTPATPVSLLHQRSLLDMLTS